MKTIKHILLILTASSFFAGCEKEIEFNGERSEPQVVAVSKPEADSVWMVRLTWSRFFLSEKPFQTIDNAVVTFKVNGAANTAEALGNGMYSTHAVPVPGDSLWMQVQVPGEESVTASCRIPQRPKIYNMVMTGDTQFYTYTYYSDYSESDTTVTDTSIYPAIQLTLDDPAGEANYYCLEMRYLTSEGAWDRTYITVDDNVLFDEDAEDELIDDGGQAENVGEQVYFTDERINGSRHTIKFSYSAMYGSIQYRLVVRALSRELYLYEKSVKSQHSSDGDFFSEPVQIICNINGGIGVLGGSASYVKDI